MICCRVSLSTGCTNDTVDQGYLFSSKPCHQSFASSHPFLYGFEFRQFLPGNEEQHLIASASCPSSTPSNSPSRNSSSPRLSSSSSDSVTSAMAKAAGFLLSSLKCGNNTSRPRCTQYRFDPFFIKYTDFHISGLIVDQMTYHFHIFNFF